MKASDIPDTLFLQTVENIRQQTGFNWVMRWEVAEHFPDVPSKVLMAKAKRLMLRKLMDGCWCGCRGDYEVTKSGIALIKGEK